MSVDLTSGSFKSGGTWIRSVGSHEACGFMVYVGDQSAHVTMNPHGITSEHGITFAVERADVPCAWDTPIDVIRLRDELMTTIVRRMSTDVIEALFGEIRSLRQRAFWEGECAARAKVLEALGL